jgi:predicted phage terminase large subunit-like protein
VPTREAVRAEIARRRLAEFVRQAWAVVHPTRPLEWAWYLDAKCEHLEAVTRGHIRRLVITEPPNTLKSFVSAVCWPAWEWATDPALRWLYGANDGPLATRDALAMRALVESDWYTRNYRRDWGLAADQDVKTWFNTTRGGHRISYSVSGKVTGKKGDRLVLDDPNDARRVRSAADREAVVRWHDDAFSGRMADERSTPEVVIGQRLHADDLIGHLLRRGGWVELRLPEEFDPARRTVTPIFSDPRTDPGELLRPARFGPAQVAERVGVLGSAGFQAQHNQNPQAGVGKFFDRTRTRLLPAVPVGTVAVRYWDTAATKGEASANTAGVLLGKTPAGRYVVLDCVAGNWTPAERDAAMLQTAAADRRRAGVRVVRTYIERPGGFGAESVDAQIRLLAGYAVEPNRVNASDGSKEDRARPLSAQWEVGNVDVLDGPWAEAFLAELDEFPGGRRVDRCDAAAGAFNKLCDGANFTTGDLPDPAAGGPTELDRLAAAGAFG